MFSAALWSALSLCPHVRQSNLAWSRFPASTCPQWLHCWLVYAGLTITVLTPLRAALYAVNSCSWENGHWLSMLRRVLLILVPFAAWRRMCVKSSNAMTLMFGALANCFDAQWLMSRMNRFSRCPIARSVSDAALGEFRRQLEYKTARNGTVLRVVDRWFPSSKTCSNCGVVKAKLSLSERTFNCDDCGLSIDRDLNAAVNIQVAGSAPEKLNARGEGVRRSGLVSGNADLGEARTKRSPAGGVRLGVGLGNEAMQPSAS